MFHKCDFANRTVTAKKDLRFLKLVELGDFVISLRQLRLAGGTTPRTDDAGRMSVELDKHFFSRFGRMRMANIVASDSVVGERRQRGGLSARSVVEYHTFLHAIFKRAAIDQVIPINPSRHTVLPKIVKKPKTAVTLEQFEALLAELPDQFRLMALVAIETRPLGRADRCGRSISTQPQRRPSSARRPRGSKKSTGADTAHIFRDYLKDNDHREVMVGAELCRAIREHMLAQGHARRRPALLDQPRAPSSRNTLRARVRRLPAIERSALRQRVMLPRPAIRPRLLAARRRRRPHGSDGPPRPPADHDHPATRQPPHAASGH